MKKSIILKNSLIIFIVTFLYVIYSVFIINPNKFQHLSLIDDAEVLLDTPAELARCVNKFDCGDYVNRAIEIGRGRLRPIYYFTNSLITLSLHNDAILNHKFRVFGTGLISIVLLALVLITSGSKPLYTFLGTALFVTSFSFAENYMRLGTAEPYQVILISIFSLLYFVRNDTTLRKSKLINFLKYLTFILALLTKETSVILVISVLSVQIFNKEKFRLRNALPYLLITAVFVCLLIASKYLVVGSSYASNYKITIDSLKTNSMMYISALMNSSSPFIKPFGFLTIVVFLFKGLRKVVFNNKFTYWFVLFVTSTLILFPWEYVLERYLLLSLFCFSVVLPLLLSKISELVSQSVNVGLKINKTLIGIVELLIIGYLFYRGLPLNLARTINYRMWYSNFLNFEYDQVKAISEYADKYPIYLNANKEEINNVEILYAIPIHLRYEYGNEYDIRTINGEGIENKYIFSRSAMKPMFDASTLKGQILQERIYDIDQIDVLQFRDSFRLNPLATFINPPLLKGAIKYNWEIRKTGNAR